MPSESAHPLRAGFTLLEVILAVSLFSLVVVGFAQIATTAIATHRLNIREKVIAGHLQDYLEQISMSPGLVPGEALLAEPGPEPDRTLAGVTFKRQIEPLEAVNEKDEKLSGLWRVRVIAEWDEEGELQTREAEVHVYRL